VRGDLNRPEPPGSMSSREPSEGRQFPDLDLHSAQA